MEKEIDYSTIEIDGIDMRDYPDFCDAYACYAEYTDGTELTESELADIDSMIIYELAYEKAVG